MAPLLYHMESVRLLYQTILSGAPAFRCPARHTIREPAGKLGLQLAAKSKTLPTMLRLDWVLRSFEIHRLALSVFVDDGELPTGPFGQSSHRFLSSWLHERHGINHDPLGPGT